MTQRHSLYVNIGKRTEMINKAFQARLTGFFVNYISKFDIWKEKYRNAKFYFKLSCQQGMAD